MKGTEKIIAHIQADANAKADAILAQAEAKCAEIRSGYEQQAKEAYAEKIRTGVKENQDRLDSMNRLAKMEGRKAILASLAQGGVKLLEPVYKMDITIPSESVGDIMGDITSRRGRVLGMDPEHKKTVIHAICPLAEIQRYAPDLRSMTSGQGVFTMTFEGYEDVPSNLEAKIIKESPFGGAKEEDDD